MPLGISMEVDYAETTLQLQPDDSITFLSDGVVEARRADGELFRVRADPGHQRQLAAGDRGCGAGVRQEDDITVLKLTLAPVAVLA
jgi:sigma-B regulation protein RsbU (phosphoserine phosphatase)